MKKVILLTLFGFGFIHTWGQDVEFPTEFAVWRYSFKEEAGEPSYPYYYYMEGDSTYMNNTYKKILGEGLIRSEDKRVYFIPQNDTIEYLMYDFNLEVGDKFYIPPYLGYVLIDSLTVLEIGTTTLYGGTRKLWSFENGAAKWVEGIGTDYGFFSEPWYEVVASATSFLKCFAKDSIMIDAQCELNNTNEEASKATNISVFPNPFHDKITIQTSTPNPIDLIQIFDLNGRLIQSIKEQSTIQMDANLPSGVYYLKGVIDGETFYKRVVKN